MHWYLDGLRRYTDFSGRAPRREFWAFALSNVFAVLLLTILDVLAGTNGWIRFAYLLAVVIPSIAVAARRMHDTGRSGWLQFVPIANLIWACQESQLGANRYGPDPLGVR